MKKEFSDLLLPDVNVLVALAWPNHQFHQTARKRMDKGPSKWATCAVTEIGFVRLSSNPRVVGVSNSPVEAAALLGEMTQDPLHIYLESQPAPSAGFAAEQFKHIMGYRQVTDAYLLGLAAAHKATFVTFDSRLRHLAQNGINIDVLGL